jgi:hypothetical protein
VRGRHRKPPRRSDLVLPTVTVAAVLSVGGVGASAALTSDHDVRGFTTPRPVPTVAIPTHPAATPAATPSPTSTATPAATQTTPWLSVTTTGRVAWVQVAARHHKVLYAGLLRHGRTVEFRQRPLRVTVGDAGAVKLVIDGKVRNPAGRAGAVLRLIAR